jgi:peptide/nickel transport system substrate-binding protein
MFAFMNLIDPVTFQEPDGTKKAVGTGPFTFLEWVQGDHFTLKKNPNYWMSGKPYLDGINIQIFSDPQAMITQLEAGALDLANAPAYTDVVRLQKDSRYKVIINKQTGASSLVIAQSKDPSAPTGNKLFRQAVNWAINRKRIVDSVYLGVGEPRDLPFPTNSPAYDATRNGQYSFDLAKAKDLLAQSGVGNPEIEYMYSSASAELAGIGQILQSDLASIGIKLTLKPMEPVAAAAALFNANFAGLCGGGILLGQLHPGAMDGSPYYSNGYNWSGFHDASNELAQLGQALIHETDPTKAKQAYAAWEDYVLDQSFAMPISAAYPHAITTAKLNDVGFSVAGDWLAVNNAWFAA